MPQAIPTPNDLYTGILVALGYNITPSGDVMEETDPVYINQRSLVLPTPGKLKEGSWNTQIPFHPLSENVYRGESTIMQFLRNAITKQLSRMVGMYIFHLAEIARSKDQKLSSDVKKFMQLLPDVDDKFITTVTNLIIASTGEQATANSELQLIHIYLKRGAVVNGTKVSRAAIVSFPFLDRLKNGDKIEGVTIRKKDVNMINTLFNYAIFGDNKDNYFNVNHTYDFGSADLYAPYFDSLIGAYNALASNIKESSYKFRIQIGNISQEDLKLLQPDLSWTAYMKQISTLRALIPALDDSEGAPVEGMQQEAGTVTTAVEMAQIAPAPGVHPPAATTTDPLADPSKFVAPAPAAAAPTGLVVAVHPSKLNKPAATTQAASGFDVSKFTATVEDQVLEAALNAPAQPYGQQSYQQPYGQPVYGQQSQVPIYLQGNGAQPQTTQPYGQPVYGQQQQVPIYLQGNGNQQQQPVYQPPGYGI